MGRDSDSDFKEEAPAERVGCQPQKTLSPESPEDAHTCTHLDSWNSQKRMT